MFFLNKPLVYNSGDLTPFSFNVYWKRNFWLSIPNILTSAYSLRESYNICNKPYHHTVSGQGQRITRKHWCKA